MNKNKTTRLIWIGVLTFSSLILFFYGIQFLQNENFQKSTMSFKVVFKNVQGLETGDEVKMLGKKIGFVMGTAIIGQNIIVDVSIDNIYNSSIPIDSRFEITSEDIMGGKYLTIYPGKDTNKFILQGDTVSGKNSEVVSLTQDIGDFAKTLNQTFGMDQKNQIIESIESIKSFTSNLEQFMSTNKDLITEDEKENLHLILTNFGKISENLEIIIDKQSDNINVAIENITDFTTQLPDVASQIQSLSIKIEQIIDNINQGKGSLAKLIDDEALYNNANELVQNANGLINDSRDLVSDFQNNPKKYIRAYFAAKREDSKKK